MRKFISAFFIPVLRPHPSPNALSGAEFERMIIEVFEVFLSITLRVVFSLGGRDSSPLPGLGVTFFREFI
jgi:hypothetical protein